MLARMTSSRNTNVCAPGPAERFRNGDEPRQHVGHLDARELGPAAVAHHDREVLAQVRDERKRMARIERQRRQHRADLAREIAGQMLADLRRPLVALEQRDLLRRQELAQLVPDRGLILEHLPGALPHRVELLLGVVAVRRDVLDFLAELLQRRRDANHEELVEVRAGDAEELHPLEQRVRLVARLREHALVELQPAQLAIDVERRVLQVGRFELAERVRHAARAAPVPGAAASGDLPAVEVRRPYLAEESWVLARRTRDPESYQTGVTR